MFALVEIAIPLRRDTYATVVSVKGPFGTPEDAARTLVGYNSGILDKWLHNSFPELHLRVNDRLFAIVEVEHTFQEEHFPVDCSLPDNSDPTTTCLICGIVGTKGVWCALEGCPKRPEYTHD